MTLFEARPMTISTHAPAGGATCTIPELIKMYSLFLLTPLREGRPEGLGQGFSREIFLLTPLREGRRRSARIRKSKCFYFYSRPCGRGDLQSPATACRGIIFLLTPLREGRHAGMGVVPARWEFLLTPLREGRHEQQKELIEYAIFLLTPLREGRRIHREGV